MAILNMNFKPTWRAHFHSGLSDVSLLLLRLWLAQEFCFAAILKLQVGIDPPEWFVALDMPLPLRWLSPQLNWLAAGWGELLFSVALCLGVFTRSACVGLLFIDRKSTRLNSSH